MIYLLAILVAAGGALISWAFGLAVFIAAFEILRLLQLEAVLDSPAALTAFRYAHIAVAVVGALWLLQHARPRSGQAVAPWTFALIATMAALGCVLLATPLVIWMFRTAQSLMPFLISLVATLIAGAAITAIAYRMSTSRRAIGAHSVLAPVIAIALVWLGNIFDVETSGFVARLGQPRTVLIDIRIPERTDRPALATIRIAMRSEGRDFPGQPHFWLPEDDGGFLRAAVPLVIGTNDRTVVLALPNEPERLLRIDLPARPRPTQDFGPLIRFEPTSGQLTKRAISSGSARITAGPRLRRRPARRAPSTLRPPAR
jgi:hypothetical protein